MSNEAMDAFKGDLDALSSKQLFRKYLLSGDAQVVGPEELFELREKICNFLKTDFNEVVLVGSAKLGFSIKPSKRYAKFGESSDIDFAVASKTLFESVWKEAHEYRYSGAYWEDKVKFFEYLARGWIRPDKLPRSKYFRFGDDWWNFFRELSKSPACNGYKVSGALYHSWFFLENYQQSALQKCKDERI